MRNLWYLWRFYTFGREQYQECMGNLFLNNLLSLRKVNTVIAVLTALSSIYPLLIERNFIKVYVFLFVAAVALFISLYAHYKIQTALANIRSIYTLITVFYANLMIFGIFLSVLSTPYNYASLFLCFLVVALLMFMNPPLFNLILTLSASVVFIALAVVVKPPEIWRIDVINVVIAGGISLYFNWHISKLRMGSEISATMLENERNQYLDQSVVDELTQLKNRRDFMQTFQRYVLNYRNTDAWLCIALADIDFFKKYNDRYGHAMGDDCLRMVGSMLNGLKDNDGIYSARVGGEEFALLWFEKNPAHIDTIVTRLMRLIAELKIPHEDSKVAPYVSMSIGVHVEKCGSARDTQILYDFADKALYTAKKSGRNCVIICGDEIPQYKVVSPS